jgi:hypothetical protein
MIAAMFDLPDGDHPMQLRPPKTEKLARRDGGQD